jgi:hypothetical protein
MLIKGHHLIDEKAGHIQAIFIRDRESSMDPPARCAYKVRVLVPRKKVDVVCGS